MLNFDLVHVIFIKETNSFCFLPISALGRMDKVGASTKPGNVEVQVDRASTTI